MYLRCYTMIIPTKHPASKLVRGLRIIHSANKQIIIDSSRQQFLSPSKKQSTPLDNSSFQTTINSFRQHHRRLQPTVSRRHPTPLFTSEQQFGSDRRRRPFFRAKRRPSPAVGVFTQSDFLNTLRFRHQSRLIPSSIFCHSATPRRLSRLR